MCASVFARHLCRVFVRQLCLLQVVEYETIMHGAAVHCSLFTVHCSLFISTFPKALQDEKVRRLLTNERKVAMNRERPSPAAGWIFVLW